MIPSDPNAVGPPIPIKPSPPMPPPPPPPPPAPSPPPIPCSPLPQHFNKISFVDNILMQVRSVSFGSNFMHLNLAVALFGISDVSINISFVRELNKFILLLFLSVYKLISLNIPLKLFNFKSAKPVEVLILILD